MNTDLMVSEGDCDAAGACTFVGSWNDPISKGKITARMSSRWTDANTEIFEMHGPGPDGKEMKMMEIVYTRRQPGVRCERRRMRVRIRRVRIRPLPR